MQQKDINVIIGKNIRLRRSLMGFSQSDLAERLGVAFQQVQKYEKGANAVSPARLMQLSAIFRCGVGELFLEHDKKSSKGFVVLPAPSRKAIHLVANFERIGSNNVKKHICDLVRVLADDA